MSQCFSKSRSPGSAALMTLTSLGSVLIFSSALYSRLCCVAQSISLAIEDVRTGTSLHFLRVLHDNSRYRHMHYMSSQNRPCYEACIAPASFISFLSVSYLLSALRNRQSTANRSQKMTFSLLAVRCSSIREGVAGHNLNTSCPRVE
jgi:hypothetical protein